MAAKKPAKARKAAKPSRKEAQKLKPPPLPSPKKPAKQEPNIFSKPAVKSKPLSLLREGMAAPDFSLPDASGKAFKLSDFRGKKVVIYFYPKDLTPGCTIEACEFRNSVKDLSKKGAVVLGVSTDSPETHRQFIAKHQLNFPLLSDLKKEVAKQYGVWATKSFLGYSYEGIHRTTYIVDEKGRIAKVFEKVNPLGHAKQVLSSL